MNVVSQKRLREFWAAHTTAGLPLRSWYKAARTAVWGTFADVKRTFPATDAVGNCLVFDIGGNKFRLIGRVNYRVRRVYVLRVMTHADYNRTDWATACGCYRPPPKRPAGKPKGGR